MTINDDDDSYSIRHWTDVPPEEVCIVPLFIAGSTYIVKWGKRASKNIFIENNVIIFNVFDHPCILQFYILTNFEVRKVMFFNPHVHLLDQSKFDVSLKI